MRFEYCESSRNSLVYTRAIQGRTGEQLIALELMGHIAIPYEWKELVFHRGCFFFFENWKQDLLQEEKNARREDTPSSPHLLTPFGGKFR